MQLGKLGLILSLLATVGCTSISSTALNRTDGDTFYGSSNGDPGANGETRPFKGIPMTVRVPTHVDVTIKEKVLLRVTDTEVVYLQAPKKHLSVESDIVYTDKVFTVDPKRPGGGSLDYNIGFGSKNENYDNRQYFKSIGTQITDTTIKDITKAIATVTEAITTSTGQLDVNRLPGKVVVKHRTVAWRRFDVDAPDFELQIQCFVEQHMNNCNSCSGYRALNAATVDSAAPVVLSPADSVFVRENSPVPVINVPATEFVPGDAEWSFEQ